MRCYTPSFGRKTGGLVRRCVQPRVGSTLSFAHGPVPFTGAASCRCLSSPGSAGALPPNDEHNCRRGPRAAGQYTSVIPFCRLGRSSGLRLLLAASYIALPISSELRVPITNSQWILVLSALFLVVGAVPRNNLERIADVVFLLLFGFTGHFCFFLLPISVFIAYTRRERWRWFPVLLMTIGSAVQASALLFLIIEPEPGNPPGPPQRFLYASLPEMCSWAQSSGSKPFAIMPGTISFLFLLFFAIAGFAFVAFMFARAGIEMKLLCVLATMVLAASLISPGTDATAKSTRWQLLAQAPGLRYWYLPALVLVWFLIGAILSHSAALRFISAPLLVALCVATVLQWRHPALTDLHFADDASRFQAAPDGATLILPENPDGWTIRLVKHERVR